ICTYIHNSDHMYLLTYHQALHYIPTRRSSDLYIETYQLVIIGHGDLFENIQTQIQDKNLHNKIVCTGKIHFSRLPAYTAGAVLGDRKSTRLNSSHVKISYAVFCL